MPARRVNQSPRERSTGLREKEETQCCSEEIGTQLRRLTAQDATCCRRLGVASAFIVGSQSGRGMD